MIYEKIIKDDLECFEDFEDEPYEIKSNNDFNIGQSYTEDKCKTYVCKVCGNDRFIVGHDKYYTAIKCPKCGWERCIHEG